MAASSVHTHRERRRHLLRRRAKVDRGGAEKEPVAAAFVDRVVAPGRVRMLLDEPAETVSRPHFLVRDDDEHEVACQRHPLTRDRCERDRARRDLVLHVERAATPDLAVDEVSRPRIALPLRRIGEHRVRVGEEPERRTVAASDARDEVGPVRLPREQLALDPVTREVRRAGPRPPASRSREG